MERIEGEDYRHRDPEHLPRPLEEEALLALYREDPRRKSLDPFPELLAHLRTLHPIRYRYLFQDLDVIYLTGLAPIRDQNDALRFVRFVDQLYNLGLDLRLSGAPLEALFPEAYRHGPFAKKYGRALSRLAELLG